MDYKMLLIKYMDHVIGHEGISFINDRYIHGGNFTEDEKRELQNIEANDIKLLIRE